MQVASENTVTLTEDMLNRCALDWYGMELEEIPPEHEFWEPVKKPGHIELKITGTLKAQCLCDGTTASSGCEWDIKPFSYEATCVGSCGTGTDGKTCKTKVVMLGSQDPAQTQGACG